MISLSNTESDRWMVPITLVFLPAGRYAWHGAGYLTRSLHQMTHASTAHKHVRDPPSSLAPGN